MEYISIASLHSMQQDEDFVELALMPLAVVVYLGSFPAKRGRKRKSSAVEGSVCPQERTLKRKFVEGHPALLLPLYPFTFSGVGNRGSDNLFTAQEIL